MNEAIFLVHILAVLCCTFGAVKLGESALVTWVCIQGVLANLFVLKQIDCFSLTVTCSDVYAVSGILSLNLLQEYFSLESAKKTAIRSFYFMVVFALMAKIHLLYQPSIDDSMDGAYRAILSPAPRILFASLLSFWIVQQIDIRLFAWIKNRWPHKPLSVRNAGSLITSQLIDTVLFTLLGLYGMVKSLFDIILLSFVIKTAVILCFIPLLAFCKKIFTRPIEPSL
ncbi:MAG: hypothetical protein EB051_00860 [Chlamydiia bacterium]|nr:hypothetical protein [Chlamydiia bacterium]